MGRRGIDSGIDSGAIASNSLVQSALTSQSIQCTTNVQSDPAAASEALYAAGTECHLVVPVTYRGDSLAALSLQWNAAYNTLDDVSQLLGLVAPQIALSLKAAIL